MTTDAPSETAGDVRLDACRSCGHSIRGLPEEGACPECATPVRLSIASPYLAGADTVWLARTLRGVGADWPLPLIGPIGLLPMLGSMPLAEEPWPLVLVIGAMTFFVTRNALRSMVDLARPDPRDGDAVTARPARLVFAVAYASTLAIGLVRVVGNRLPDSWCAAFDPNVALVAGIVCATVAVAAACRHIAWLAERVPAPQVAERFRRVGAQIPFAGALLLPRAASLFAAGRGTHLVLLVLFVAGALAAVVLLMRLRGAAKELAAALAPIRELPAVRRLQGRIDRTPR